MILLDTYGLMADLNEEDQKPNQKMVGNLYLQVALHRAHEQYAAYVHLQNRASRVFGVSVAVLGITTAAVINLSPTLSGLTLWISVLVVLLFLGAVGSSALAFRARRFTKDQPWLAGPSLPSIEDRLRNKVPDHLSALWLGKLLETSHDRNKSIQDNAGKWLNRSLLMLVIMLIAIVLLAISILLTSPPSSHQQQDLPGQPL